MSFSLKPLLIIKGLVVATALVASQGAQAQSFTNECSQFRANGEIKPQFSCSEQTVRRYKRPPTHPQPPQQQRDWRTMIFDNAFASGAGSDGGGSDGGNGR